MYRKGSIILITILFLSLCSCSGVNDPEDGNAVYYWRTSLTLNESERRFIADNGLHTIYLHLFDIERAPEGSLRPTSTLIFKDSLPHGIEIVPVVFMTPNSLSDTTGTAQLGQRIVARVTSMMTKNGYPEPRQLQIDFDWTRSNQNTYFTLLQHVADIMHRRGGKLSVTIRLHQLNMPVPPADSGVLMIYNTGNFNDIDESNSILSVKSVIPYIKYLADYKLPLGSAFPIYSWNLVFSDKKFKCIARNLDLSDTASFRPVDHLRYRSLRYRALPMAANADNYSGRLFPGDIIRHEYVEAAVIDSIKTMIGHTRPSALNHSILYHLDSNNISLYDSTFFENFYLRGANSAE